MRTTILFFAILLIFFASPKKSFAKTDLSITESDVSFSKDNPLAGELIKIYARIFNYGDDDVLGYVLFLNDGEEISNQQPVSLKPNTYDDVFVEWKAMVGTHNIKAKIISLNVEEENIENNEITKKDFFVDLDNDGDGIGNSKDTDADGDGLSNDDEQLYGTNPLNPDSDNDGVNDKIETQSNTNPNKSDTDGDGVIDSKDEFPLDMSKTSASLSGSITNLLDNKNSKYLIFGVPLLLLILFFLFPKKKRRRK